MTCRALGLADDQMFSLAVRQGVCARARVLGSRRDRQRVSQYRRPRHRRTVRVENGKSTSEQRPYVMIDASFVVVTAVRFQRPFFGS